MIIEEDLLPENLTISEEEWEALLQFAEYMDNSGEQFVTGDE